MFNFRIIRSHRRTLALSVSPEKGVIVRAPLDTTVEEINNFIEEKSDWIEKHIMRFEKMKSLSYSGRDGEHIMFLGREYPVELEYSLIPSVRKGSSFFLVLSPAPDKPSVTKELVDVWFKKFSVIYLYNIFDDLQDRHSDKNLKPTKLKFRKMKGKWGSCNSKGIITLNSELSKLDVSLIEYVIVHELCHLKHPNHGKEFYNLLESMIPDWKTRKKELRKYILS